MGRVKLAIKTIETAVGRRVTYSKRRAGLEKKAQELATLCDIDLLLILFSPAGKPSWINGSKSPPEEVLMRFANLSPQDRAKRKVEALEQLKRVFKKLDHNVNVEDYTRVPTNSIEELHQHLQNLQLQFLHLQQRLRLYETYQTLEEANSVERVLQKRLEEVRSRKQQLSNLCVAPYNESMEQQIYADVVMPSSVQQHQGANWDANGSRQQTTTWDFEGNRQHSSSNWDTDGTRQLNNIALSQLSSPMFMQSNLL
uniref:M13 protein n=1 Tax=Ceratopteris richardii TaxID=49495 RepID=G0KY91_CERRI|nr:M13 protein [Ceratopteris richardii]